MTRGRWFALGILAAFALSFGGVIGVAIVAAGAVLGSFWLVSEAKRLDRVGSGVLSEARPRPGAPKSFTSLTDGWDETRRERVASQRAEAEAFQEEWDGIDPPFWTDDLAELLDRDTVDFQKLYDEQKKTRDI